MTGAWWGTAAQLELFVNGRGCDACRQFFGASDAVHSPRLKRGRAQGVLSPPFIPLHILHHTLNTQHQDERSVRCSLCFPSSRIYRPLPPVDELPELHCWESLPEFPLPTAFVHNLSPTHPTPCTSESAVCMPPIVATRSVMLTPLRRAPGTRPVRQDHGTRLASLLRP